VLEYLYKGDYFPKLMHNKRKDTWEFEDVTGKSSENTIYHTTLGQTLLKDTAI